MDGRRADSGGFAARVLISRSGGKSRWGGCGAGLGLASYWRISALAVLAV